MTDEQRAVRLSPYGELLNSNGAVISSDTAELHLPEGYVFVSEHPALLLMANISGHTLQHYGWMGHADHGLSWYTGCKAAYELYSAGFQVQVLTQAGRGLEARVLPNNGLWFFVPGDWSSQGLSLDDFLHEERRMAWIKEVCP